MSTPPSLSASYPALRAKKLSWADHMDSIDEAQEICSKDSVTLEEFARLIYYVLHRCELDTTKTAHHFQIKDTFVDLMYRDHVLISISKKPMPEVVVEEEEEEEEEEVGRDSAEEETSVTDDNEDDDQKLSTTPTAEDEPLTLPVMVDVAEKIIDHQADADGWTPVVSKRVKQACEAKARLHRLDTKTFFCFSNEANAHYMDFVGLVQGLDGLLAEAKKHRWSHGYHVEGNMVYDFNEPSRPGLFRHFIPNTAYLHKFKGWFEEYQANGDKVPEDLRVFYVFRENSVWPKWSFMGEIVGLRAVRQVVLQSDSEYGHAYCLETNDLANFWLNDGHLHQSLNKAPTKYIVRFEKYLDTESESVVKTTA